MQPLPTASAADAESSDEGTGSAVRFGTFTGVFTPTLLTIFGVIMYVRVGWSVGNAGLAGTWLVMGLAILITSCTALSLSSIATNTRVGPGGPYAILSRSLGIEVGGSIGLPLYLTRPLGVAMYIIGFREGWLWLFPTHDPLLVDLTVFTVLAGISYVSTNLAFRVQFLIMAVVAASLVSIFGSPDALVSDRPVHWWGDYPGFPEDGFTGTDFWAVFAVFFPATTGILAGANMSGDLKNPRRAIPVGTLWALGVSTVVYMALAWWCERLGDPRELVSDYNLLIDHALWPPIVLAGLLGATASSALAGLVGGPRILMAMGRNRIVPMSETLGRAAPDGNPRAAIVVTAILTLAFVMVRDLNAIAPVVTMFFLITYGMLNVVVLIESSLGLVSFRPTLRVPRIIPAFGLVGCLFSMFIVHPAAGLISVAVVVAFYLWIRGREDAARSEGVRSSVFVAMAQWAASRVGEQEQENQRAWKPNLLVPVKDPAAVSGVHQLLVDLTRPDGSITLLGLEPDREHAADLRERLVELSETFRRRQVQSSAAVLHTGDTVPGTLSALEALQAAFFRPNLLVLRLRSKAVLEAPDIRSIVEAAAAVNVGMILLGLHPQAALGERRRVNLWVRPAPNTWRARAAFRSGNLNLNLLTGYRLLREWGADVRICTVITDESDRADADAFLGDLCDLARYPARVRRLVFQGSFMQCLADAPPADVHLIGLAPNPERESLEAMIDTARASCIFVWDSGRESALV